MSFYVSLTSDYEAGQPASNFTTPLNTMINLERDYNVAIVNVNRITQINGRPKAVKSTAIPQGVTLPPPEYPKLDDKEKTLLKEFYEKELAIKTKLYFHAPHGRFAFTWTYGNFHGTLALSYPEDGLYFETYLSKAYEGLSFDGELKIIASELSGIFRVQLTSINERVQKVADAAEAL